MITESIHPFILAALDPSVMALPQPPELGYLIPEDCSHLHMNLYMAYWQEDTSNTISTMCKCR